MIPRTFGEIPRPVVAQAGGSRARPVCDPSDVPLPVETIGDSLRASVERFGHRGALVVPHQGYRATYAELWAQVDRAARAFMAIGVAKCDRIGIWAPNRSEWVVTQFAAARIGAILVTIDPATTAAELAYVLEKSGVSVLVMARASRFADYVRTLEDVRALCPTLRETIVLEDDWDAFLVESLFTTDEALAEREAGLAADEPINVHSTPGASGWPEGVTLTHLDVAVSAPFAARRLGYGEHVALASFASVRQGACLVVDDEGATTHSHAETGGMRSGDLERVA